jgi:hypothetical protein
MGNKTRHTANLVSDNNLFVDIANDRVGIGSTQPTAKLNVVGVVSATSFRGDGSQLSGLLSSTGDASNLTNLTGASAATYGDGSNVAAITVDANGRITGISEVSISGGGGGASGISSIGIQSGGILVGSASTINFITSGSVSVSNDIATVSIGSSIRFVGARMYHDDYSVTTSGSWTEVANFDGTSIDTNSFANATNGRFTIPAGVSKVRISTNIRVAANGNTNNQWSTYKNGSLLSVIDGGFNIDLDGTSGYNNPGAFGQTAIISVVEGDYFNIRYYVSNTSLDVDLWYQIEVVEGDILGNYFAGSSYTDADVDSHLNQGTASTGEVLSWNGSDYDWVAQSGGGGGIALTDLSVTQNSVGTAALSYNNSTGVFTYTPPDLSSYLTSYTETDPVVAAINGIVKSNGTTISAATAGTDYLTPNGNGSGLTNLSAGNLTGALPAIDGSALTNVGAGSTNLVTTWTLGANSSNHYTFTGPGVAPATDDPTIYLVRGQTYKFENRTGGHPFRIQYEFQNTGGTAYSDGIPTNPANNNDDLYWEVRNDAPDLLHYQCTSHTNMSGRIVILGDVVNEGSWTASAGSAQTIDTITGVANNAIKTAEYTIHIENGSNMQAQKVLVMQDGTTAFSQEYAIMHKSGLLVSMSATISGGNLLLQATPETGVSGTTTYKVTRQTMR